MIVNKLLSLKERNTEVKEDITSTKKLIKKTWNEKYKSRNDQTIYFGDIITRKYWKNFKVLNF